MEPLSQRPRQDLASGGGTLGCGMRSGGGRGVGEDGGSDRPGCHRILAKLQKIYLQTEKKSKLLAYVSKRNKKTMR